jgi:hypothetical protein
MSKFNETGVFVDDISGGMSSAIESFKTTGSW